MTHQLRERNERRVRVLSRSEPCQVDQAQSHEHDLPTGSLRFSRCPQRLTPGHLPISNIVFQNIAHIRYRLSPQFTGNHHTPEPSNRTTSNTTPRLRHIRCNSICRILFNIRCETDYQRYPMPTPPDHWSRSPRSLTIGLLAASPNRCWQKMPLPNIQRSDIRHITAGQR